MKIRLPRELKNSLPYARIYKAGEHFTQHVASISYLSINCAFVSFDKLLAPSSDRILFNSLTGKCKNRFALIL